MSDEIQSILNSNSTALDEDQINAYCSKNQIDAKIIQLSQLAEEINDLPVFTVIYTGSVADSFNNGYKQHWILLTGNHLFDSYGNIGKYTLPESIKPIITYPPRLQEYGSSVCGQYCLAVASFISKEPVDEDNLGSQIVSKYVFTKDRKRNDEIVLAFYDQTK